MRGKPEPTIVMAANRLWLAVLLQTFMGEGGAGGWSGPRGGLAGSRTVQSLLDQGGIVGSHWRVFSMKVTRTDV